MHVLGHVQGDLDRVVALVPLPGRLLVAVEGRRVARLEQQRLRAVQGGRGRGLGPVRNAAAAA